VVFHPSAQVGFWYTTNASEEAAMSDTATFVRIESSETAPAVWRDDWLPSIDAFPELTQAREDYLRLRNAWSAAGQKRRDLEDLIADDTERRKTALRDAYIAGETNPQAAGDNEKLTAALAAAKEQSRAASEAYVEHINRCIALVLDHQEDWQGEITAFQESVDGQVQALLEQARTLRITRSNFARLEHWLTRTVEGAETPYSHFPYADVPAPPSGNEEEEEARLRELMLASYAGGINPDKPVSEEQMAEVAAANAASQKQKPVADGQEAEVELNDLDEHELAEWIMGCGMFDGNAKPSVGLVIEAAVAGGPEFAARILQAERLANPEAKRQDVLDRLTEITKGVPA
jgi:hypothetical protein